MLESGIGGPVDHPNARAYYSAACIDGVASACKARYKLEGDDSTTTWRIDQPPVRTAQTNYPEKLFQSFDEVTLAAGGCVNTHGAGATTKRYVNPSGPNSDRLYSGMISIPGATAGLVRVGGVVGKVYTLPLFPHDAGGNAYLKLGYQDDDYSDNDYSAFDDGTENQCRGAGPAWVQVSVRHHTTPDPNPPKTSQYAPMDLFFSAVDDNLLPLNPNWAYRLTHSGDDLPDAASLCNHFENKSDKLDLGGCTSQAPSSDEHAGPDWWVAAAGAAIVGPAGAGLAGLDPNNAFWVACQFIENGDQMRSTSVHGHVNWGNVAYTGSIYFEDYQAPTFDEHQPFGFGDGDYDLDLVRPGQEGVVAGNTFRYRSVGPRGLTLEFDSREVIDHVGSPWWISLRDAVGRHPANTGDWTAPQAFVDGREAIVVGLMGIDTKHSMHAEVHPVLGLAIHIDGDDHRERWAFFARPSGNEGGCSQDLHHLGADTLEFFFPSRDGVPSTYDASRSTVSSYNASANVTVKAWPDGLVLKVPVPQAGSDGIVDGEIEICRGACQATPISQLAIAGEPLIRMPPSRTSTTRRRGAEEGSVASFMSRVPKPRRAPIQSSVMQPPAAVSGRAISAVSPPVQVSSIFTASVLGMSLSASRISTTGRGAVTSGAATEVRRAHRLTALEPRVITPASGLKKPNVPLVASHARISKAIRAAMGEPAYKAYVDKLKATTKH